MLVSASQLLGRQWAVGARYRLSEAEFHNEFQGFASVVAGAFQGESDVEAVLHRVALFTLWNHPSGLFAEGQALWYSQNNRGYALNLRSDDFWQLNLFAGYRFAQRRAELRVGLLNITDEDYRLIPLNLYGDLPRERTFYASFRFYF